MTLFWSLSNGFSGWRSADETIAERHQAVHRRRQALALVGLMCSFCLFIASIPLVDLVAPIQVQAAIQA